MASVQYDSDPVSIHERIDRDYDFYSGSRSQNDDAEDIRSRFRVLAHALVEACPSSRERSIAFNKLQEAKMWAVQSIYTG